MLSLRWMTRSLTKNTLEPEIMILQPEVLTSSGEPQWFMTSTATPSTLLRIGTGIVVLALARRKLKL